MAQLIGQYFIFYLGSTEGGNDVVDITNVGVVNHAHFGSLTLHSGHKYYATVTGSDSERFLDVENLITDCVANV